MLIKFIKKFILKIKKKLLSSEFKKTMIIAIISIIISILLFYNLKIFFIGNSYKIWTKYFHLNEIFLGLIFITIKCLIRVLVEKNYNNIIFFFRNKK